MEAITFDTADLIKKVPIQINISGHRAFFLRNRLALRVLKFGALIACAIGKNLHIEISV